MPKPQVETESLGFLLGDLSRLIRAEFERRIALAGVGLTAGEGRTLLHVARAGRVRQTVLAERMGVEAMTLSLALDRLEARRLIERRPDPTDRRAKLVGLTAAADDALAALAGISSGLRDDFAATLGEAGLAETTDRLKTLRDALAMARLAAIESNAA